MLQIILPSGVVFQSVSLALIDREEKLQVFKEKFIKARKEKLYNSYGAKLVKFFFGAPTEQEIITNSERDWLTYPGSFSIENEIDSLKKLQELSTYASEKDMLVLSEYEFDLLRANLPPR